MKTYCVQPYNVAFNKYSGFAGSEKSVFRKLLRGNKSDRAKAVDMTRKCSVREMEPLLRSVNLGTSKGRVDMLLRGTSSDREEALNIIKSKL